MRLHRQTLWATASILLAMAMSAPGAWGDEPSNVGGWQVSRDDQSGLRIHTMEMTLHPTVEPRPALKYRLIPADYDMEDGNAAVHYLKAVGFLEQGPAQKRLQEIYDEAGRIAREEDKSTRQVAPHVWQSMSPRELPLKEVKEFLELTAFQQRFVEEGTRQRTFDLDRNLREADDPIGFLIPEIQATRELARMQHLRCKVAIAEDRIDDAIAILGQLYTMSRHFGQDDFLVSTLVGISFAGLAWEDALYLVQHEGAPNLYWAFASVPRPAVDTSHALAMERHLLIRQVKVLGEVGETPRPAGYWQDFVDRLVSDLGRFSQDFGLSRATDPENARAGVVAFIAGAYPSAKRYLIEDCGLDRDQVEAYPTAQTVFLAVVRYYEEAQDGFFKWNHLPYWQTHSSTHGRTFDELVPVSMDRAGWIAAPAAMLLPAVSAVRTASARIDQQLALVQTVEAIRIYGAANDGKLPSSLDDLPLPAPMEPLTGKPLDYRYHGDYAVLNGHDLPGIRYRLVLRFAK